jgi:cation diffusion facilitator family transporter
VVDTWIAALKPRTLASASLGIDVSLLGVKLMAALLTGSLGLLSEALHSGLDLVASIFALVGVRAARKPADPEHPYGHGRAENLAALGEGVLLLLAAVGIGYEGGVRLVSGHAEVEAAGYALALLVGVMALEASRATVLLRAARIWASPALAASGQNRLADIGSAAGVLAGLVGVRFGLWWADAAAALMVAALIARAAALLIYRSGDILIDRAPVGVEDQVRRIIAGVAGVRKVGEVRVRRSGARLLGDAHVSARPTLSVEGARQLSQEVRAAVERARPDLDLAIVVEPQPAEDDLVERVHTAAARQGVIRDLHNVTVEREQDGSLHLSMHAKLPAHMTLGAAGAASEELERRLREEFLGVSRVDVHLEPLEPALVSGADVTAGRGDLAVAIRRIVEEHPLVRRCRDVELSAREDRIVAYVVAEMPGEVSLERAHAVETELEERLRRALPDLSEVVARAVP